MASNDELTLDELLATVNVDTDRYRGYSDNLRVDDYPTSSLTPSPPRSRSPSPNPQPQDRRMLLPDKDKAIYNALGSKAGKVLLYCGVHQLS